MASTTVILFLAVDMLLPAMVMDSAINCKRASIQHSYSEYDSCLQSCDHHRLRLSSQRQSSVADPDSLKSTSRHRNPDDEPDRRG